ncbi:class I SAM-dependent methyltransferase [Elioraea sp.]|uniref:class I SAM-dependent methyltransferase n=1 Tax=Elioraea sp. TaxID=2185103 RepID=UPI0025C1111B|nr:class I SAM-dependent methyltransferase [Elioraea sp.]
MSEGFSADWLSRREPFDARARSPALAARLAEVLPARPRILELGAGAGSLFRWLAPRIGRAQVWTMLDADGDLLADGFDRTAAWAARRGWNVTAPSGALIVHAPGGAWRIEARVADFGASSAALPLAGHDAVVCSALFDLISAAWVRAFAARLAVPFLACLTVDGRDRFIPPVPGDARVRTGFARHMRSDKGFGRAMGQDAPAMLARILREAGFDVASAPSDWLIPRMATTFLADMVEGHAGAAADALPAQAAPIHAWSDARRRAIAAGRLSLVIGHRDILALPKKD